MINEYLFFLSMINDLNLITFITKRTFKYVNYLPKKKKKKGAYYIPNKIVNSYNGKYICKFTR